MNSSKKILYIQHAGSLGGSSMSLLYTMQEMRELGHNCTVALTRPTNALKRLYTDAGFETCLAPGIYTFEHTTASWWSLHSPLAWPEAFASISHWQESQRRTRNLLEDARPDLVHLNSVVLVPSALELNKLNVPFVWHVREAPAYGYMGLRKQYLKSLLCSLPSETVFLSEYDKWNWVADKCGTVVPNFVDFMLFDHQRYGNELRGKYCIDKDTKVLLYLGGLGEIKGILPLLDALAIVQSERTDWVCIMPGSEYQSSNRLVSRLARTVLPIFGKGTVVQQVQRKVAELGIDSRLRILPFIREIAPYFATCDVLLFPSIRPHFARPIIEAAAMKKPSIGSNLGGVNELIEHNHTGLLVEPNSPEPLADAILKLIDNKEWALKLGENAYHVARDRFDAKKNVKQIERIYTRALAS